MITTLQFINAGDRLWWCCGFRHFQSSEFVPLLCRYVLLLLQTKMVWQKDAKRLCTHLLFENSRRLVGRRYFWIVEKRLHLVHVLHNNGRAGNSLRRRLREKWKAKNHCSHGTQQLYPQNFKCGNKIETVLNIYTQYLNVYSNPAPAICIEQFAMWSSSQKQNPRGIFLLALPAAFDHSLKFKHLCSFPESENIFQNPTRRNRRKQTVDAKKTKTQLTQSTLVVWQILTVPMKKPQETSSSGLKLHLWRSLASRWPGLWSRLWSGSTGPTGVKIRRPGSKKCMWICEYVNLCESKS